MKFGCSVICFLALRVTTVVAFVTGSMLASAGHYSVSYSGGTIYNHPDDYSWWSTSYAATSSGAWGAIEVFPKIGSGFGAPDTGSVSMSGEITATFTWVPDYTGEPTPASAVLVENVTTNWAGDSGSSEADIGAWESTYSGSYTGRSSGARYTVISSPGTSRTTTCSPTVDASAYPMGDHGAVISLEYGASLVPVTITILGAIGATPESLPGQYISASLTCADCTFDDFSWGIIWPGFPAPDVKTASWVFDGSGTPTSHNWQSLASADFTGTTFAFLPLKSGTQGMLCSATAYALGPTGSLVNIGSVSANGALAVINPIHAIVVDGLGTSADEPVFHHKMITTGVPPGEDEVGILFSSIAITPSDFRTEGSGIFEANQELSGTGEAELNETITSSGTGGAWWLDAQYPYLASPVTAADGSVDVTGSDKPMIGQESAMGDTLLLIEAMDFRMHLIYVPPPNALGSEATSLAGLYWNWHDSESVDELDHVYGPSSGPALTSVLNGDWINFVWSACMH